MESKQESQPPQARQSTSASTGNAVSGAALISSKVNSAISAPAATSSVMGGPSAAQAITAPRPPKSAADRLRELDLSALSYEQRVLACGELSRIDHAHSAALRYATAVSVETPEPMRRVLRDCAELARQDAQRIAGEVLVRLGVE